MYEDDISEDQLEQVRADEKQQQYHVAKYGYPDDSDLDELIWRFASMRAMHQSLGDQRAPPSVMETSLERVVKIRGWAIRYLKAHPDEWPGYDKMTRSLRLIIDYWKGIVTEDTSMLSRVKEETALDLSQSCICKASVYADFLSFSPDDDSEGYLYDDLMISVEEARILVESKIDA